MQRETETGVMNQHTVAMQDGWFYPDPFWPKRTPISWKTALPVLAAVIVSVDTLFAPLLASSTIGIRFTDYMGSLIVGLDEAASTTQFSLKASLILAVDRALVPIWIIVGVLSNVRLAQINVKHHPFWILLFLVVALLILLYVYFHPLVPDPESVTRSRQAIHRLVNSGVFGFSIFHGIASWALVLCSLLVLNVSLRFKSIVSAHRAWLRGPADANANR